LSLYPLFLLNSPPFDPLSVHLQPLSFNERDPKTHRARAHAHGRLSTCHFTPYISTFFTPQPMVSDRTRPRRSILPWVPIGSGGCDPWDPSSLRSRSSLPLSKRI
jgi:hypothetical protein